ncbi:MULTISPECIES: hypothetical protein [unclassified Bacteroides]|uniref:hypothetical protein n=1 Tax=Bacteroides TaxID=816 RepID=UPI0025BFFEFB|nr:hypothetical protein [Bacteroides sp.]
MSSPYAADIEKYRYHPDHMLVHETLRPEMLERERAQTLNTPEDEARDIDTVTG